MRLIPARLCSRFGLLGSFAGALENSGARPRRQPKSQAVKLREYGCETGNPALRFGAQQDSKRACYRQFQCSRVQSSEPVIQNDYGRRKLHSQCKHLFVTGPEVRRDGQLLRLLRKLNLHPGQYPDIRQVDTDPPALLQLGQDAGWNQGAGVRFFKKIEQAELVQVLDRRRIADRLTRS